MKTADKILVAALLSPIPPGIVMGATGYGWFYLGTNVLFFTCFGLMELWSVKTRKKSISRDIANTPGYLFWFIIMTWEFMQLGIGLHWYMMR